MTQRACTQPMIRLRSSTRVMSCSVEQVDGHDVYAQPPHRATPPSGAAKQFEHKLHLQGKPRSSEAAARAATAQPRPRAASRRTAARRSEAGPKTKTSGVRSDLPLHTLSRMWRTSTSLWPGWPRRTCVASTRPPPPPSAVAHTAPGGRERRRPRAGSGRTRNCSTAPPGRALSATRLVGMASSGRSRPPEPCRR